MAEDDIAQTYRTIFDSDPLLIREKSQVDYSNAMLQHLLVDRTKKSCDLRFVDLHSPKLRRAFRRRRSPEAPPPPPAKVGKRYRKKRQQRGIVSDADYELLKRLTMVPDGRKTAGRRKPNGLPGYSEAREKLRKAKARSTLDRRLKVAAVSHRVAISRLEDRGYFDEDLCMIGAPQAGPMLELPEWASVTQLGRTRALDPDRVADWEKAITLHIERAFENKCQIVVLPEFGLPSANGTSPPIADQLRALMTNQAGEHFLFAGSRHEGGSNRGLIFSKKGKKVSKRWWHYKVASARGLGENILGAHGKRIPSYLASFNIPGQGRTSFAISVAICYDTFDPTTFLMLVLLGIRNHMTKMHNIILVPSFNPSEDFVALLRDLSFIGRCTVVYVNSLDGNAKMFICGFAVSDLAPDRILKHLDKMIGEFDRDIKKARVDIRKAAKEQRPLHRSEAARRSVDSKRHKRDIVDGLKQQLIKLNRSHALDYMVTVERTPHKRAAEARGAYVETDTLYYSIDMRLLGALLTFREDFFKNDTFLPAPFFLNNLVAAAESMEEQLPD